MIYGDYKITEIELGYLLLMEHSLCIKYADDVTILHFIRPVEDDHIQSEWHNAVNWAERYHMPLNTNKCSIMSIVTKKNLSLSPVFVAPNIILKNMSCVTFLGISFTGD